MKRFVVGALFGLLLSLSVTAYAEEVKTLVGRTIEGTFPVKLNGNPLENQAIVIDGTSYLPVREIAEKLNMSVKFDPQEGILLGPDESKVPEWAGTVIIGTTPVNPGDEEARAELEKENEKIKRFYELQKESQQLTKQIEELYKLIEPYETFSVTDRTMKEKDAFYEETKKQRDELISRRDQIDAQIQDILKENEAKRE